MDRKDDNLIEVTPGTNTELTTQDQDLKTLTEMQLSIEDKAAHLSLQVNQVIIKPYLNQSLDYLINSRDEVLASYHNLSNEINQEVTVLLEANRILAAKVAEAKELVAHTQALIRNRYNSTTEFEIASGVLNLDQEYNTVAENYERSMQFSQEIIKNRMRIESLLETQRLLDSSLGQRMIEIQLEIDNLSYLLDHLHSEENSQHDRTELLSEFSFASDLEKAIHQQTKFLSHDPSLQVHTSFGADQAEAQRLHSLTFNSDNLDGSVAVKNKELFVVKQKKAPVNLASKTKK